MTPNELADYLEKSIEVTCYDMTSEPYAEIVDESYEIICQAATSLRQQHAEIEALKARYETPRTPSPRLSHSEIGKLLGKKGY